MIKRIFSVVLIYTLIYIALAFPASASDSSTGLATQIAQLDEGQSWEDISSSGQKFLAHPQLTPELRFELLTALAKAAFIRDDFVSSEHYLKIMQQEYASSPHSDEHFFAVKLLAINTFHQGRYISAIEQYLEALKLASARKKPLEQADMHNNLGLSYINTNELERAIYHYSEAQNLYQKHGRLQDQADILLNMSGLYIKQYRYDIAEEMLVSVLKMLANLNDGEGMAIAHSFMGKLLNHKGENDKARHHFQAALEYYQSKNDTDKLMAQYAYLANISIAQGDFEQAQKEANFALYYAEKISNLSGKMQALLPLAKAYFVKGDLVRAKQMVDESLSLAQTLGAGEVEPDELATLALVQAGLGEYEESIRNFNRFKTQQYEFLNENVLAKMVDYQNRIEAAELNREIAELKQKQAFQALQIDKREQVIWLSAMVVLSLFIAVVSLYFKQAEKNAKVQLKEKVAERTAELQRVADELREASQVKNQFLANISHEIRTPLTSIIGQAEAMLYEHGTNQALKDSLGVIQRQGKHLKELVSDVLDLSRIEAQRFELEYSDFTLQTLLDDINGMFKNACQSKGLNFNIHGDFEPALTINLDYMRLKQVLINLLGNAVKFTERGRVTLHIESQPAGIVFKVIDTGIGMSQEQLGRVFESFQQGDNSITRRFGGSGLGLCLSQQLTEMMGGSISVKSELGVGSEFSIFVPCSAKMVENAVPLEVVTPVALAHGKVLIAEDHDDNRALFERILKRLGLEVVAARNGKEAVEMCLMEYPDVVLMDIQMPIMDGVEALNLLLQSGFEQPVYALTANVMEHEIQSYLDAGFYGHLGKPLDTKVLHKILHKHLGDVTQAEHHSIDMSDLVASFASSLPSERDELIELWERKDWLQVQKVCHRLSGAASTFEFSSLANTSRQLERMLIKKEFKQAEHLYLILCDELNYIGLSEELDAS